MFLYVLPDRGCENQDGEREKSLYLGVKKVYGSSLLLTFYSDSRHKFDWALL